MSLIYYFAKSSRRATKSGRSRRQRRVGGLWRASPGAFGSISTSEEPCAGLPGSRPAAAFRLAARSKTVGLWACPALWRCAWIVVAACIACNGQFHFDALDAGSSPPCASDRDCPLASLHCDTLSGVCVQCTGDSQCTGTTPRCDTALHVCVQCGTDGDCSIGQHCNPASHACSAPCPDAGGCPADAPLCALSTGVCVQCVSSADCVDEASRPTCDASSGLCVACTADAECAGDLPRCAPDGACVECLESSDCPADLPACDPSSWTCSE